jgi:uncharacterized protein (TIRG00374 family)
MDKRWKFNIVRYAVVFAIFVFLYQTDQIKLSKIKGVLVKPELFVIATILILINVLITVQRWRVLLKALGISLGKWHAVKLTFIAYLFGAVLPGLVSGDLVKAYYISKGEKEKAALVTTVFFDRFVGFYSLILMAAVTILLIFFIPAITTRNQELSQHYMKSLRVFIVSLFLLCTIMGMLFMNKTLRRSKTLEKIIVKLPFHQIVVKVYDTFQKFGRNPRFIIYAFLLSLTAQFFVYAGFFCLSLILEIKAIATINYLFVLPVCLLINAIPLAPGGLGVGEAGFRTVFLLFGSNEGAELAVLFHAIFFILAIGLGGLMYLFSDITKEKLKTININSLSVPLLR